MKLSHKQNNNLNSKINKTFHTYYISEPLVPISFESLSASFKNVILTCPLNPNPRRVRNFLKEVLEKNSLTFEYIKNDEFLGLSINEQIIAIIPINNDFSLPYQLDEVSSKTLKRLQEVCYTIEKNKIFRQLRETIDYQELITGGLHLNQNGEIEPKQFLRRGNLNINKIRIFLLNYKHKDGFYKDIAFSSMFTKDQRAKIHEICKHLRIKSKSSGKDDNRTIVISKVITDSEILEIIKSGTNDDISMKYNLICPTNKTISNDIDLQLKSSTQIITDEELKLQFSKFIIIKESLFNNPKQILQRSADLNKLNLSYQLNARGKIAVKLSTHIIAIAAKNNKALEIALERLEKFCYAIEIVVPFVTDEIISNSKISTKTQDEFIKIDKTNIGYKLLLSMGWDENKGLGAQKQGTTQPIPVILKQKLDGIGFIKIDKNIILDIFKSYIKNKEYFGDIVFSDDLADDNKKEIIKIGNQFGLIVVEHLNVHELIMSKNIFASDFNLIDKLQNNIHVELTKKYKIIKTTNVDDNNLMEISDEKLLNEFSKFILIHYENDFESCAKLNNVTYLCKEENGKTTVLLNNHICAVDVDKKDAIKKVINRLKNICYTIKTKTLKDIIEPPYNLLQKILNSGKKKYIKRYLIIKPKLYYQMGLEENQ